MRATTHAQDKHKHANLLTLFLKILGAKAVLAFCLQAMNEEVKKSLLALKDDTSMGVSTKCDKMLKLLEGAGLF